MPAERAGRRTLRGATGTMLDLCQRRCWAAPHGRLAPADATGSLLTPRLLVFDASGDEIFEMLTRTARPIYTKHVGERKLVFRVRCSR